jgi:hypothetical protein
MNLEVLAVLYEPLVSSVPAWVLQNALAWEDALKTKA